MNAVILAGGPLDDVARLQPGAPNKAFVEIGGVDARRRVVAALRAHARTAAHRRRRSARRQWGHPGLSARRRISGPTACAFAESLRNGLEGFPPGESVLVSASDLPVLTVQAISDFVERRRRLDADVVYGCVEKSVHLARFPEVPHTWARMRDGTYLRRRHGGDQAARVAVAGAASSSASARRVSIRSGSPRSSAGTCSRASRSDACRSRRRRSRASRESSARRCARSFRPTPKPGSTSTASADIELARRIVS